MKILLLNDCLFLPLTTFVWVYAVKQVTLYYLWRLAKVSALTPTFTTLVLGANQTFKQARIGHVPMKIIVEPIAQKYLFLMLNL